MTEPVDTPQLDALVEERFVRVEGRRLDGVFDRVLDFAVRPVRFGGVLQLEDYFGIGVHAPEDRKAPAPPRGRWTASVDFGRSLGLTDADEDFAGLVSNRIYLDLDAPYPDDAWADSSPGGANIPQFDPRGEGFEGRRPSPQHLLDDLGVAHPELLKATIRNVRIVPYGRNHLGWLD